MSLCYSVLILSMGSYQSKLLDMDKSLTLGLYRVKAVLLLCSRSSLQEVSLESSSSKLTAM